MRPRPDGAAGRIEVSVTQADGIVTIAVADDGIGLPQGDRTRLMEPYVTHKPKGTGLGLAIVKKIMEDHGGSVTLDDRQGTASATTGAVATLTLPAAPEMPQAAKMDLSVEANSADGA